MSVLSDIGIYPDAIESAVEKCENIIQEMQCFAKKYGYDDDIPPLNIELDREVLATLEENLNIYDMTNSIISAYFEATTAALESTQICEDFGLTFENYVNCDDSHLYFKHKGIVPEYEGTSFSYNDVGDMDAFFAEAVSHIICDVICDRYEEASKCAAEEFDEKKREFREYIAEDIHGSRYDDEDIIACIHDKELVGTIKETADDFAKAVNAVEHTKPTVERE